MKVPLVHNFDFTFAYRYERFEISGIDPADGITESTRILQTDVPKFALRWAPVRDLTLRASYSRSFRAPTLSEFFEPHTENSSLFPLITIRSIRADRRFVRPPRGTIIGGSVDLQPERTDRLQRRLCFHPAANPEPHRHRRLLSAEFQRRGRDRFCASGSRPQCRQRLLRRPRHPRRKRRAATGDRLRVQCLAQISRRHRPHGGL